MRLVTAATCVLLSSVAAAPTARAQQAAGFVSVNAAIQEGSQRLAVAVPVEIFDGAGTLTVDDGVIGGSMFDVSAGVRGRRFAFGAGYSRSRTHDAHDFTASTVSAGPGSFTRSANGITPNLEHSERVLYLFAAATRQVTNRFDVMASAGPAFLQVTQDVPTDVTLSPIFGEVQHVSAAPVDDSALGVRIALDLNYMFRPRIGIGVLAGFTWGSVNLPNSTKAMTLGGVQLGAGVRARF